MDSMYERMAFLLTRPLRGATFFFSVVALLALISTHTPLAGRDVFFLIFLSVSPHFYSHAPCGARLAVESPVSLPRGFLLTRPLRGATQLGRYCAGFGKFLLTRPLRGATCQDGRQERWIILFLLTRPLRGATGTFGFDITLYIEFLLTRPLRGATGPDRHGNNRSRISTHTPLAGRDIYVNDDGSATIISTHTPLAGRDVVWSCKTLQNNNFYSHAPCGARQL